MKKLDGMTAGIAAWMRGKVVFLILSALGLFMFGWGAVIMYDCYVRTYDITIAAGTSKSEGFALMEALQVITKRYYPRIHLAIRETTGSEDSLKRLDSDDVQLAVARADITPTAVARTVAILYDQPMQLLVHSQPAAAPKPDAAAPKADAAPGAITKFSDLQGKRIAMPKTPGQLQTFLAVASRYGLSESDFKFFGGSEEDADLAFVHGDADALFRVGSLHTTAIPNILKKGGVELMAIDGAAALHEINPAFQSAMVPKGYYSGNPDSHPPTDLPTVGSSALLLAREDINEAVIYALADVMADHKNEWSLAVRSTRSEIRPLAFQLKAPSEKAGILAAAHRGAEQFFRRDQSSFVSSHLDFLAWLAVTMLISGYWIVELRNVQSAFRKTVSDSFNQKVCESIREIDQCETVGDLLAVHVELTSMMTTSIELLGQDKMGTESFLAFHAVWQLAMDAIARRQYILETKAANPSPEEKEKPLWHLSKVLRPRA
jgi:TRAP transporter TAXI family solute receptor